MTHRSVLTITLSSNAPNGVQKSLMEPVMEVSNRQILLSFSWLTTVSVLLLCSWFRWVCIYRYKQQRHMNVFTLICLCSQTHCPGWLPPAARCSCWGSPRGRRAPLECRAAVWTAGWWCSQRAALQGGDTCEPQHKHQTREILWSLLISICGLWTQSVVSWRYQSCSSSYSEQHTMMSNIQAAVSNNILNIVLRNVNMCAYLVGCARKASLCRWKQGKVLKVPGTMETPETLLYRFSTSPNSSIIRKPDNRWDEFNFINVRLRRTDGLIHQIVVDSWGFTEYHLQTCRLSKL